MTSNYTMSGSLMPGLYENTIHFRIGDTSRPELTPYRVVIRGGCLDYEDPMVGEFTDGPRKRYPADYVFRLYRPAGSDAGISNFSCGGVHGA